jgi:hypothetical protein
MSPTQLIPGSIMQLHPGKTRNPMFGACFFVVDKPTPDGARGYIQCTGENGELGGLSYYYAVFEEMEPTGGVAVWFEP